MQSLRPRTAVTAAPQQEKQDQTVLPLAVRAFPQALSSDFVPFKCYHLLLT